MIYFVQAGERPFVKVGYAACVSTRLALLQCGCPDAFRLIGTIEGDRLLEASVHSLFARDRHRSEWFHLTTSVDETIAKLIEAADPVAEISAMLPTRRFDDDRAQGIHAQKDFFAALEAETGLTPYAVAKRACLKPSTVVGWSNGSAMPAWAVGHLGAKASVPDHLLSILSRPWRRHIGSGPARRIAGVARKAAA